MPTLHIVGSGIQGVAQLTQEAAAAIRKCKRVVWVGAIAGLPELLARYEIPGEDLSALYVNGAVDQENYTRIRERALELLRVDKVVAFVIAGHPRLGVTVVQQFQMLADVAGIEIVTYPGISSFDTMINDLGLDPLEEGTCVLDANRLLLYNYQMEPVLNYFIYHVCSIGNAKTDYLEPLANNKTQFLQAKLLQHYTADHPAVLISSSSVSGQPAHRVDGKVGDIVMLLGSVTFEHTLFIPQRLPTRDSVNWDFLLELQGE
jgi:precorrin-4 methylase